MGYVRASQGLPGLLSVGRLRAAPNSEVTSNGTIKVSTTNAGTGSG